MQKYFCLDIGILDTPEVEQPENMERTQDNPKKWKIQEDLELPELWRLNACQWCFVSEN